MTSARSNVARACLNLDWRSCAWN